MHQYKMLDGNSLAVPIKLCDTLADILDRWSTPPIGLIGLDKETGLVKVQLSAAKVTHMKLGKLLKKAGRNEDVCRDYSSKLRAVILGMKGAKLEFTTTSEEAYDVYDKGPHSCMSGNDSTGAYCSDSIAVAYIKVGDRIISRAVVCTNPELDLRHSTVYGNSDIMLKLLRDAGFVAGGLEGCTLARIVNGEGEVLCPYLDCGTHADDKGTYILIDSCGEFETQNTSGLLKNLEYCDNCSANCDPDNRFYSEHTEQSLCEDCHDSTHVYVDGTIYHKDSNDVVEIHDGSYIMMDEATFVDGEGDYYPSDECIYSEWNNVDYVEKETVRAVVEVDFDDEYDDQVEVCHRDDCKEVNGTWVHDSKVEEYEERMNPELDL
jgi:hypothetical protein